MTGGGPGAGAGTTCWKIATLTTAAAVHTVLAKAPHFVLPFQKRAATSNGESAAKPEKAYWIASSKIVSGARKATAYATSVINTMKRRPVCTCTASPNRFLAP